MDLLGGRYYVTFDIGMTESFEALGIADCDRIIAEAVNGRESLSSLDPSHQIVITDPLGVERTAVIGDYVTK